MKDKIEKIFNSELLNIISRSFINISAITIVASLFTLLTNFPIESMNIFLEKNLGSIWTEIVPIVASSVYNFISIYIIISSSFQSAKKLQLHEMTTILTSLMVYLMFIPITNINGSRYLDISYINSSGIFLALLCGLIVPIFLKYLFKKNIIIKMPNEVPDDVSNSFKSLTPVIIVIFTTLIFNIIINILFGKSVPDLIVQFIQMPIIYLGSNLISIMLMNFGISLFWFFGFNGTYLFNPIIMPILTTLSIQNLNAISIGNEPVNIITGTFQSIYTNLGGSGSTLALIIALLLFTNNTEFKKISKISFLPGIFNINEPVLYGLPVIMNPKIFIPFVLCPVVNTFICYFAILLGIVNYTNGLHLPWTTPIIISGFFASGISGAILQIIILILNVLIYIPFVRMLDKNYKPEV